MVQTREDLRADVASLIPSDPLTDWMQFTLSITALTLAIHELDDRIYLLLVDTFSTERCGSSGPVILRHMLHSGDS